MPLVYLSLGSNIGDRAENIEIAFVRLAQSGVRIRRRSSFYLTEPVGLREQEWFLNCTAEAETNYTAWELLRILERIEQWAGRQRAIPNGPRTLDLDLLLFGDTILHTTELELPHPRMSERRFVLVPLAEIAPSLMHPVFRRTIAEMLSATSDASAIWPWTVTIDAP